MLFWEAIKSREEESKAPKTRRPVEDTVVPVVRTSQRLPYDKRCAARTKKGHRCKAKVRPGSDFCAFHDPGISEDARRNNASKGGRSRNRLAHLPDGYLRKLDSVTAVGNAMDRLYREVRLGIVTPEMGRVLLAILNRVLETQFGDAFKEGNEEKNADGKPTRRTKVHRVRPKLNDLLTKAERQAWEKAIANAPPNVRQGQPAPDNARQAQKEKSKSQPAPSKPRPLSRPNGHNKQQPAQTVRLTQVQQS